MKSDGVLRPWQASIVDILNIYLVSVGYLDNAGYALYFIMNPIAACYGWACWSNVCGFLVIGTFKSQLLMANFQF